MSNQIKYTTANVQIYFLWFTSAKVNVFYIHIKVDKCNVKQGWPVVGQRRVQLDHVSYCYNS